MQRQKESFGFSFLIIHADADASDDSTTFRNKIEPGYAELQSLEGEYCEHIIALVPVQMTEAWMLADKDLLIRQIGTKKSVRDLGIAAHPESFSDPKEKIEEAIRIGRRELSAKRRSKLQIGDLYSYFGEALDIECLMNLASYRKFYDAVQKAFRAVGIS